jgi:hypothetical protein
MNKEDLKKNYILLSKIAKENKYAQEYLGLLARRGDIGSIRIGKRWYVTREWFSEFLQDAQERKEKEKQIFAAGRVADEKIAIERKSDRVAFPVFNDAAPLFQKTKLAIEESIGIENGFSNISDDARIKINEKVAVMGQSLKEERIEKNEAIKISIPTIGRPAIQVRQKKIASPAMSPTFYQPEMKRSVINLKNTERARGQVQEKEQTVGYRNIVITEKNRERSAEVTQTFKDTDVFWDYEIRIKNTILSPAFPGQERTGMPWFPKLAFGFSFVLLFFLLFQGTVTYRKDIMKFAGLGGGTVAGISDERKSNLSEIRLAADYFISNQDNQMKESVSLSQLMLKAALEKEKNSTEVK